MMLSFRTKRREESALWDKKILPFVLFGMANEVSHCEWNVLVECL
ncbi:hypothetical protein [Chryseobacterium sp. FH2]|nr:hypothetical protein [Chryseobacterium sp. FH2]